MNLNVNNVYWYDTFEVVSLSFDTVHNRKAADQGHPHAAYNLAVGHLRGYETDLKPG